MEDEVGEDVVGEDTDHGGRKRFLMNDSNPTMEESLSAGECQSGRSASVFQGLSGKQVTIKRMEKTINEMFRICQKKGETI